MGRRRFPKLPKEPVHATIESLSHDGRGIARLDGQATFIQGALPGEEVNFIYTAKKAKLGEGYAVEVLKPADMRVDAKCAHFDVCGGCSMQHMPSDEQINLKQSVLKDQLKHIGGVEPESWLAPLCSSPWGYRHKGRLSVRYVNKKEDALVGFRERMMGRFVADIKQCEILHPKVGHKINDFRALVASMEARAEIAQIEVAMGDDDDAALIFRHLSPLSEGDLNLLTDFAKLHEFKLFLQPKGPDTIHLHYPKDGDEFLHYRHPSYDLTMAFYPTDFTQVNPHMNAKMVEQAMQLLAPEKDERILDLFCGLGNFSLPIARRAGEVIGVEGAEAMVKRAYFNAEKNGINNAHFYAADLTQAFASQPWALGTFDKLLIDPPRSGALEIIKQIDHFNVDTIVYVSCDPATLARDSKVLIEEHGYKLITAGVMDMFPHTKHVESIALFKR